MRDLTQDANMLHSFFKDSISLSSSLMFDLYLSLQSLEGRDTGLSGRVFQWSNSLCNC